MDITIRFPGENVPGVLTYFIEQGDYLHMHIGMSGMIKLLWVR
jgi:hypothetical protein